MGDLPPGSSRGVGDSMTTKLEMIIGYLAGKQGKGTESIRRELEDPASEASRWIEAVRRKTRDAYKETLPVARGMTMSEPLGNRIITTKPSRKRLLAILSGLSVASLIFVAVGLTWRAHEYRIFRLESILHQREARWASRFDEIDAAIARQAPALQAKAQGAKEPAPARATNPATIDGPTVLTLARIEAKLGQLGERLREPPSNQTQSEPLIDELRRDIERLKNDVEARDQSRKQESRELNSVIQEVLQILRGLTLRPLGAVPMQSPMLGPLLQEHPRHGGRGEAMTPGMERLQGNGQIPGQGYLPMDPSQANQNRGASTFPGGYMGPRMHRPGGPG